MTQGDLNLFAYELLKNLDDPMDLMFQKPEPKRKPKMPHTVREKIDAEPGYPKALYMGTKKSYKKIRVYSKAEEDAAIKEGCKTVKELFDFKPPPPPAPGEDYPSYIPKPYPKALYKGTKEDWKKIKVANVEEEVKAINEGAKTHAELFLGKKSIEIEKPVEPVPKRAAKRK